jgi:hypothetical protein
VVNAAIVWEDSPEGMELEKQRHDGYIAWMQQRDADFALFSEAQMQAFNRDWLKRKKAVDELLSRPPAMQQIVGGRVVKPSSGQDMIPQKLTIQMMGKYDVLRYCNKHLGNKGVTWRSRLKPADLTGLNRSQIMALHCFLNTGPLKEQGSDKRQIKVEVMSLLKMWVVKYSLSKPKGRLAPEVSMGNFSLTDYARNHEFVEKVGDIRALNEMKRVWMGIKVGGDIHKKSKKDKNDKISEQVGPAKYRPRAKAKGSKGGKKTKTSDGKLMPIMKSQPLMPVGDEASIM